MSTVLSYGFKLPQDGDTGANNFWDDLEFDITQLNSHSHNGTDSAKLTATSITAVSHNVDTTTHASDPTLGWVLQAGTGEYKRTIAIANFFASLQYNQIAISWRVFTATVASVDQYDLIFPTIIQNGISTYDVYVNDISQKFLVVYTS